MVGPAARAYLDALWALLAASQMRGEEVKAMVTRIEGDKALTDLERASLLAMLAALGGLTDEGRALE
jgi:hypothetical protein